MGRVYYGTVGVADKWRSAEEDWGIMLMGLATLKAIQVKTTFKWPSLDQGRILADLLGTLKYQSCRCTHAYDNLVQVQPSLCLS